MGREFAKVGVIGLGTMGAGITEVLARSGVAVVGVEVSDEAMERGRGHIEHSTARAVERGKLTDDEQRSIFAAITFSTSLTDVKDADLVIEAVPEKLALKQRVLVELDGVCPPETILATNTSSLSVTEIAVATSRPSRVIGMHFFNPAPIMKLIEVIATVVTDPQVVTDVEGLVQRLGKVDVTVSDRAGFIANALLFGYLNHAVSMYESRFATREDIDAAMKLGCGLPMGPLALMDLIGIDTAYEILDTMYRQGRDRLHAPSPLIKQMASAGMLGRKTGRGFYTYQQPDSPVVVPDEHGDPSERVDGSARPVASVGVVGSGTMAAGLVEVFARAGYHVTFVARAPDKITGVQATVARSMDKAVLRGKLEQADRDTAAGRITGTTSLDDLASCDLVVEAVIEDLAVKQALFAALDEVCRPGAVLASTTSSLPIVECAAATSRLRDVVGMHFFNPAPVMKLVEVVRTVSTDADVVATATAVCERLGKHPVICGDRAGFIVNALLFPYLNDAVRMLEVHYASADDIDAAMKVGCGYPMGPFELLDVVGLDVSLAIQRSLYLEFREPGFAPAPLLEHLVTAGYLGRKTGRGFRDYTGP
ncbi:MAG: 3-hydroxybutyryl-CoA dehydrogenase [Actinomycetota bacterium]|nr:3-hydroxybutyryl-CoA dehydrogenase [Actinomycetota bacterium]